VIRRREAAVRVAHTARMSLLATGSAVLFPALLWGVYHHYRDRRRPEPWSHSLLAIVAGIGAGALGQALYRGLAVVGLWRDAYALAADDLPGLLLYSIFGIGFVEELAKLVPFLLLAKCLKNFDERVDGIVYSGLVAVGFAIHENVFYLDFASDAENVARAITGPLVHIVFASLWGYPVGAAIVERKPLLRPMALGLGAAVLVHGTYDFLVLGLPGWARIGAAALVVAVWMRKVHLIEYVLHPRPRPDRAR
jgi:RsiW-degrading membrane proteinase PrsW (M82 family)